MFVGGGLCVFEVDSPTARLLKAGFRFGGIRSIAQPPAVTKFRLAYSPTTRSAKDRQSPPWCSILRTSGLMRLMMTFRYFGTASRMTRPYQ